MSSRKWKSDAGLTFIEILVVLLLVAMIMALVAVSSGAIFGGRLSTASGKLMATIRYAYDRATMTGKIHMLVVDVGGNKYWIEELDQKKTCEARLTEGEGEDKPKKKKKDEEPSPDQEQGKKLADTISQMTKLPNKVTFLKAMAQHNEEPKDDGEVRILFFPDGTAEKALIWIQNDNEVNTVEVRALQGRGVLHREELGPRDLEKM